jgi:hypothetical protein
VPWLAHGKEWVIGLDQIRVGGGTDLLHANIDLIQTRLFCCLDLMQAEHGFLWARQEINAIRRRFLWTGTDGSIRGRCMVYWAIILPAQRAGWTRHSGSQVIQYHPANQVVVATTY